MGLTTLTLPRLGETMEEARVTLWLVAPGAAFKRGDILLEVETDKTVVEVPALTSGTLLRHLVAAGEMVQLNQPVAEVEVADEVVAAKAVAAQAESPELEIPTPVSPSVPAVPVTTTAAAPDLTAGARLAASPRARAMARGAGVFLSQIVGTGRGGRITGEDVARLALGAANDAGQVATAFGALARRIVRPQGTAGTAAGTPVVLIHGLFDDGRGWRDLPDKLARAGHPVIVPDLPGHGESEAQVGTLAEAETALMACLPPAGPLRLAGHSLGAVLAVRLALRLGPRVEGVVICAPAGLGPRIAQSFFDAMMAVETPEALAAAFQMLGAAPVSQSLLAAELVRLRSRRTTMGRLCSAVANGGSQRVDIREDVARLACPVAAIFGLDDRILDWTDCAALPAAAAIHLVAGAGHLPHLADPALFLQLLGVQEKRAALNFGPLGARGGG